MDIGLLERKFALMGARVQFREIAGANRWRPQRPGIDVGVDAKGEFFDVRLARDERVEYEVVDLRAEMRHLLLMGRNGERKEKYLCGHDERHWFVCAVPGASVSGVLTAMESLQPAIVRRAVSAKLRRRKNRFRRRNEAFVRQGEWFFLPVPDAVVPDRLVLRNEPISRGAGSKPHTCQYAYRMGGTPVWVCSRFPNGVWEAQYKQIIAGNPKAARWDWRRMVRGAGFFARGRVWHRDHKTVVLDCWHRVVMNTEGEAPFAPRVVFLD
jgi:hypothetical protein